MAAIRGINFELVGDHELRTMLAALPKRTRDQIIAKSFRTRLRAVRDAARAKAPVLQDLSTLGSGSQGRVPGTLRRNIRTPKKFAGRGRLGVGVYISRREAFDIPGDSPWFYPAHVHYGHSVLDAGSYQRLTPSRLLARTGREVRTGRAADQRLLGNREVRRIRESLLATGKAIRNVAPRPFMRDAWLEHKDSIETGVIADLREEIPLAARELMGRRAAT